MLQNKVEKLDKRTTSNWKSLNREVRRIAEKVPQIEGKLRKSVNATGPRIEEKAPQIDDMGINMRIDDNETDWKFLDATIPRYHM